MDDASYRNEAEQVFLDVEDKLDNYDWDLESDNKGDILTVRDDSGDILTLTKNFGQKEIWLVVGTEAYRFKKQGQNWVSIKNSEDTLFKVIHNALNTVTGEG